MAEARRVVSIQEEIEGDFQGTTDFVFCRIGDPVPLKPADSGSAFELATPPSQPLAVSNIQGLLFLAHSKGFMVANTEDVIGAAKATKNKRDGQCIQRLSLLDVKIGRVSILALSGDSSMLAATVGGEIHLFSVQSLISKVQEPVCSCFLDKDAIVRDLKWQRNSEKSFIALSNHGYLSHGSVDLLLKGLMDNVDAVDWSVDGNFVAIAQKDSISILSSNFKEKFRLPLLFQSWSIDNKSEVKVDSIKWVRDDSIVIGCVELIEDGGEGRYLIQVVTSRDYKLTEVSCEPVVFCFPDLFEGLSRDMLPAGVGPYLLLEYLDCWGVVIASNKKKIDQHISLLRWLVEDNMYDVVSLELGSEKYLPRIDLQDDGDDNLILGLAIDKSSYGKISILQDMEVKELSSRCILLCVTCDGKLTLYHAAWVAEPPKLPKTPPLHGDNGVNERLCTNNLPESSKGVTTASQKDRFDSEVSYKSPVTRHGGKNATSSTMVGDVTGKSVGLSIPADGLAFQSVYAGTHSSVDSSNVKHLFSIGEATSLGITNEIPFAPSDNSQEDVTIFGKQLRTSSSFDKTTPSNLNVTSSKPRHVGSSAILHSSSVSASAMFSGSFIQSDKFQNDFTIGKQSSVSSSVDKTTPSILCGTSSKPGHVGPLAIHHTSSLSPQQVASNNSKGQQIVHDPELSKQFYGVNGMLKELDALLSSIECDGGFKDTCTIFQKNSLLSLEVGLGNLLGMLHYCKSEVENQLMEIQRLNNRMLQVSTIQVYTEGILKQAFDKRYWEIWNSQKLSPEFEAKRQHILNLKQNLVHQLVELERHFNNLEINRYGECYYTMPNSWQAPCRTLASSRQTQSLHSVYSTINSQLAAAEHLSECLSKQMALLNVTSSTGKQKDITKELFESIGLDHISDTKNSLNCRRTNVLPYSVKALKEPSLRCTSSAVNAFQTTSSRRRKSSIDKILSCFVPSRTTVKRTLMDKQVRPNLDMQFKVAKDVFDSQVKAFDLAQKNAVVTSSASIEPFSIQAEAFDITKQTSSSRTVARPKDMFSSSHSIENSPKNFSKKTIDAQSKGIFKWAIDRSNPPPGPSTGSSSDYLQSFNTGAAQSTLPVTPSVFSNTTSKKEKFGSKFMLDEVMSSPLSYSSSTATKTSPAFNSKSYVQNEASISTSKNVDGNISTVKAAFTTGTRNQLSPGTFLKSGVDSLTSSVQSSMKDLAVPNEKNALTFKTDFVTSSASSLSSNQFEKPMPSRNFLTSSKSYAPSSSTSELSPERVPALEASLTSNKITMVAEHTKPQSSDGFVDNEVKEANSSAVKVSSAVETVKPQAFVGVKLPLQEEEGLHALSTGPTATSTLCDSSSQQIFSKTPAISFEPPLGKESGPSAPGSQLEGESSVGLSSSIMTAEEGVQPFDVGLSQEDEMDEEAPDTSSIPNLESLSVFGVGSTASSTTPKVNPFGSPFAQASTGSASPVLSWSASPGQLFRPPSFNLPASQPTQQAQATGGSSSGFSSFGQPAQVGAGQQALGSVLGAFGQSRQIGFGVPAFGSTGGGFATAAAAAGGGLAGATSGGGFASLAQGGSGFTAMASSSGGFAAAAKGGFSGGFAGVGGTGGFAGLASGGGGFSSFASVGGGFGGASSGGGFSGGFGSFSGGQGGGFSGFGGGSSAAGRPPAELLTQMRK
ncbi:hypothetical protein HPP92_014371 [Vanilla planifolia]|uniref:Nuclear pore complex protein NUP214 n=1 Tax=Vanilla planifolia TaxID=51239 RepID=A0A835QQ50_VANPL|nr:hypothetical protein HPP92_014371 [Vanilla planifolia]